MTIQEAASEAIAIQNACNLSGVAHSMLEAIAALRNENKGTEYVNTHPIVTLFLSKLVSLNRTDCLCSQCLDTFGKADSACNALGVQL